MRSSEPHPDSTGIDSACTLSWKMGRWVGFVLLTFAAIWLMRIWGVLFELPFASDSYVALLRTKEFAGPFEAFDLAPIYRPFEILWFYIFQSWGWESPGLARVLPFAKHLGACVLLFALARHWGLRRVWAAASVALFVCMPHTKVLGWVMAHSTQGRSFWVLAGFLAFLRFEARPQRSTALLAMVCFGCALLNHPGAIELPAICIAWIVIGRSDAWRTRWRGLLSPALIGIVLMGAGYTVFHLFLLPQRYHGMQPIDGLPANGVRAVTVFLPDWFREQAVEGLRGNMGGLGYVLGGGIVGGVLLGTVSAFRKAGRLVRFSIVALCIDLAVPILTTGFGQRHAYLAYCFLALALMVTLAGSAPNHRNWRVGIVVVLALGWLQDTRRDLAEQQEAGVVIRNVLADCRMARERLGPDHPIIALNVPTGWGKEFDIPVFAWGFEQALERESIAGPMHGWRTVPSIPSTSLILLAEGEVAPRARQMQATVLRFDNATMRLEPMAVDDSR